jgi:uncharacterized protein YnzC (UPF0291/DUF896 family)
MNIKIALKNERIFKAITWITIKAFYRILPTFKMWLDKYYEEANPNRKRRVWRWGRKWALKTAEEKLFMLLFYIKHYPTYDVLAFLYWVSRSKPHYRITKFLPVLEKALDKEIVLPKRRQWDLEKLLKEHPEIKEIFVDWTEREINKPKKWKYRKKYYSGKKKRHTMKNTIIIDDKNNILYIWCTVEWKKHDKRLYDEEWIWKLEIDKYGDTGYVWWIWIQTPVKKKRNKKLTEEEKEENRILSSFRVAVEHSIWRMKFFWIVWKKFRNRIYGNFSTVKMNMKDKVMAVVWWLVNLENKVKLWII